MSDSIDFNPFYRLLKSLVNGEKEMQEAFNNLLNDYMKNQTPKNPYDQIGKIICSISISNLFEYVGLQDINQISKLEKPVWDYLELKNGSTLFQYLISANLNYLTENKLVEKVIDKWDASKEEIEDNKNDLIIYVIEGVIDIVIN